MEGLERFDGNWENTQGQAFSIKDGIVTMGDVTQKILIEGDMFRLDQDSWTMKRDAKEVVWKKGKYSVSWKKVEEDEIDVLEFEMMKTNTSDNFKNLSNLMDHSKKCLDDDIALLDDIEEEEEIEAEVSVASKLTAGEIVPDVLSAACDGMATVAYGDSVVSEGVATLTPTLTKEMPTVSWKGSVGAQYTVIMTDPDAISRQNPLFREFVHFAAVNVTGSSISSDSDVQVALQYAGPGPPYNSGLHRYVWLVYEQAGEVSSDELSEYLQGRGGKKVDKWCREKGMTLAAANFYEAEWDEHCDENHKQIGFSPPPPYQSPSQQITAASNKLKAGEIVPDVLADASCSCATITYGESIIGLDVAVLTPTQTKEMPTVSWQGTEGTLYTVIMTDPDAISRQNPLFREFVHYAAVNVSGSEISADSDVQVALQYAGPGPPYNTGLHRYAWLVYAQTEEVNCDELSEYLQGRGGKKVDQWCVGKGMKLVAGNYYEAEWDEHCDENHKQIGFMPPAEYQSPLQKIEVASNKLKSGEVVPDVLKSAECASVTVTYGENIIGSDIAVLTPTQTKDMPTVSWKGSEGTSYTVIMTDPDAISRQNPLFREFVHYAAVNVTGSELSGESEVQVALQYAGPGPPFNSGLHRYVWLVYAQTEEVSCDELAKYLEGRGGKKVDEWCQGKGMTLVAGNYYEAEWDEECDENHKRLGFVPPAEYQSPSQKALMQEKALEEAAEADVAEEEEVEAADPVKEEALPLGGDEVVSTPVNDDAVEPSIMLTQDSRDPAADEDKAKRLKEFQAKLAGGDVDPRSAEEVDREREMDPDRPPSEAPKYKKNMSVQQALAVSDVKVDIERRSEELEVVERSGKASRSIEIFEAMSGGGEKRKSRRGKKSKSRSPQPPR